MARRLQKNKRRLREKSGGRRSLRLGTNTMQYQRLGRRNIRSGIGACTWGGQTKKALMKKFCRFHRHAFSVNLEGFPFFIQVLADAYRTQMDDWLPIHAAAGESEHTEHHHMVEDRADSQFAASMDIVGGGESAADLSRQAVFFAGAFQPGLDLSTDTGHIDGRTDNDAGAFLDPFLVYRINREGTSIRSLDRLHATGNGLGHFLVFPVLE